MASFADIMGNAEGNIGVTGAGLPYVPGMPQGQVQPQAPQMVQVPPMQGQAPAQPQSGNSPPASPEEFEQRRQGWTQVLGEFMKQPNAKQIMLMVGLKLLQGRQPGQTLGQQFGSALGTGVMTNSLLQQNQVEAAEKQRKQQMEDEKHGLDVRRGTAQADKAEAENDFYAKTRGQAMEEITLRIENLKKNGKFEDARLVEQEFQNGNLKAAWELSQRNTESQISARNAQVEIQRKNADKVPAAGQARADMLQLVKDAYPQEAGESEGQYKQRIAQIQLQLNSTSKGNNVADLLKLAELTEDGDVRAELLEQARAGIQGRQVPAAKPAPGTPATGRGGTKATAAQKADWINRARAANPNVPLTEIQRRANEKFK